MNNASAICRVCARAVHPDAVQQFRARIITASRVLLEWKPPSRPGVAKYKVRAVLCVPRTCDNSRHCHADNSIACWPLILHIGLVRCDNVCKSMFLLSSPTLIIFLWFFSFFHIFVCGLYLSSDVSDIGSNSSTSTSSSTCIEYFPVIISRIIYDGICLI